MHTDTCNNLLSAANLHQWHFDCPAPPSDPEFAAKEPHCVHLNAVSTSTLFQRMGHTW
jgi:hypothetical protein